MINTILVGVKVQDTLESEAFFRERADFLENVHEISKNPYMGGIDRLRDKTGSVYTFILNPVFPRVYIFGLLYLAIAPIFTQRLLSPWSIPGIIMASTFLLFWPPVYYLGCKAGLRKKGYLGKVLFIRNKKRLTEALNRFIEGNSAL